MSHPACWIVLLLVFTSAAGVAATVEPGPTIIAPVIPAPGATTPAAVAPPPAMPGPTGPAAPGRATPSLPSPGTPANATGAPAPSPPEGPSLAGSWQAIEVIVFDRPLVGLEPKGEQLLTDAPRTFPARLQSFEPAGVGGSVIYPAGPDARMCLVGSPGTLAPPGAGAPEAFARSSRTELTREQSGTGADAADSEPPAAGDAALAAAAQDGAAPSEPPDPRAELERALRDYEAGLEAQSLTWLPQQANPLAAQARRLVDSGYRILFHRTWIQNLALRSPPPQILVQADRQTADGASLEGIVQVNGNRGPRIDATLWYRPADADPVDPQYIGISEVVRLGDGQIHYIDHPKLGIIVRSTAVGVPATISEAWATLSLSAE